METWFLMDSKGGVVGPVPKDAAIGLLRDRPGLFVKISRDGTAWSALKQQPQVQALVTQEGPAARRVREEQDAQRVLFDLDRFRELKPHELFGVPESSSKRDYRQGFLGIAKRYHPGRLSSDVAPALLKAHMAVYQYLSEVMHKVEESIPDHRIVSSPTPVPRISRPTPTPLAPRQPLWRLDALNLKPHHNQLMGSVEVTPETAFIFSAHRLMNLKSSGGVFFPCMPTLAMGTRLELTFSFKEANQVVTSRGTVAFESTFSDQKQLRGFGVQLESLKPEVKGFMIREAERLAKK